MTKEQIVSEISKNALRAYKTEKKLAEQMANPFDWKGYIEQRKKEGGSGMGGTRTFHDVSKTDKGTRYTRQTDAEGAYKYPKDVEGTVGAAKRGRGRPAGKYGAYTKKVKESIDIIESLSSDEEVQEYINSLDENTVSEISSALIIEGIFDKLKQAKQMKSDAADKESRVKNFGFVLDNFKERASRLVKKYPEKKDAIEKASLKFLTGLSIDSGSTVTAKKFTEFLKDLDAVGINEAVELDEISQSALKSYIKKASVDIPRKLGHEANLSKDPKVTALKGAKIAANDIADDKMRASTKERIASAITARKKELDPSYPKSGYAGVAKRVAGKDRAETRLKESEQSLEESTVSTYTDFLSRTK